MSQTTLALGDLIFTVRSLYFQLQQPVALITLLVGAVSGAFSLHKGVGKAAGKVIGGVALASLIFGGLSLARSINYTVDSHSGAGAPILDTGWLP